jgi:hypothetical protein
MMAGVTISQPPSLRLMGGNDWQGEGGSFTLYTIHYTLYTLHWKYNTNKLYKTFLYRESKFLPKVNVFLLCHQNNYSLTVDLVGSQIYFPTLFLHVDEMRSDTKPNV